MHVFATLILVACFNAYVYGESHLVCKQMDEVFSSHPTPTVPSRSYRNRPGKRGVEGRKGEKGENGVKGEMGEQATIDFATINATIREYISEIMAEFQEEKTKGEVVEEPKRSMPADCPIPYNNKCYVPKTDAIRTVAQARAVCAVMSGKLADIQDQTQMDYLIETIRNNYMSGQSHISLWTGMTINPQNGEVKYSDGRPATGFNKWYSGYPITSAGYTNVGISVNTSPKSASQYLWNEPPSQTYYPLCEI